MHSADREILQSIRNDTSRTWTSLIGDASDVVLLDVPSHRNAGDSMIWGGEVEYLRQIGKRVALSSDLRRYSADVINAKSSEDTPLLLHGGGNFGDVWPVFQRGREEVVRDFPRRKIIQLPQSIKFETAESAARANAIFGAHADFTLIVRDEQSLERASRGLPDVRTVLSPDAALGWSPAAPDIDARGVLALLREDHEALHPLKTAILPYLGADDEATDWHIGWPTVAKWHLLKTPGRVTSVVPALRNSPSYRRVLESAGNALLEMNLDSAVRLFAGRPLVVTDRLHAHVLATLLGIPNIVFDNSYGKISAIVRAYTGQFSTTNFVSSMEEGLDLISDFREPAQR
ncbi:polysaccharide pyruvyl transferase family protein [Microbacterium trichothecenolyticum]|uniref:Putative pyruvyl transferase EpsO n=1 Tax=Microbacterium trichothecenolyticum TaxID=69370 RepID=A0A0M2H8C9_MICTR|nr:polysaccharide pyruvyl transferase family protein [Microbacterium trichothecenolyticum]KJL40821.1 putative pyruvyl transferase EpsO [Microbacterium trichothecenolyticum]